MESKVEHRMIEGTEFHPDGKPCNCICAWMPCGHKKSSHLRLRDGTYGQCTRTECTCKGFV